MLVNQLFINIRVCFPSCERVDDESLKRLQVVDSVTGRQETFDHPLRVLKAANLPGISLQVMCFVFRKIMEAEPQLVA